MKPLAIAAMVLVLPSASFAEKPAPFLTTGDLKRYIDSYLEIEGAAPIPREEALKATFFYSYVQGMIAGVQLSDRGLEPAKPVLEKLDHGDVVKFLGDLRAYLIRMKNLDPGADGYKVISYFLMTNYTENPSVKLKFAPMMLEELTKGKPGAADGTAEKPR